MRRCPAQLCSANRACRPKDYKVLEVHHMNYMFRWTLVATLLLMGTGLPRAVRAQDSPQASGPVTLFENVGIFDGKSATLSTPSNVLVRGNKIETISTQPIAVVALDDN